MAGRERPAYDPPGCCICSKRFFRVYKEGSDGRRAFPFILKCSHSACDFCITAKMKLSDQIVCNVCKVQSPLPDEESNIQAVFPPNSYLTGLWSSKNQFHVKANPEVAFTSVAVKKESKKGSAHNNCSECAVTANAFCESCQAMFCQECFTRIHTLARVLMDHKCVSLNHDATPKITNVCSAHPSKKLDLFCIECDVSICSECLIPKHNQHKLQSISEKNKECLSEIRQAYVDLEHSKELLTSSLKKAKQALKWSVKGSVSNMETRLSDHFSQLHACLLLMENDLLNTLQSTSRSRALNSAIEQTEEYLERISLAMSKTRTIVRYEKTADFKTHLRELRELSNLPNVLVAVGNATAENNLTIDSNIFKQLEEHITLKVESSVKFELKSEAEAPEEVWEDFGDVTGRLSCVQLEEQLDPVPRTLYNPSAESKPSIAASSEAFEEKLFVEDPPFSRPGSRSSKGSCGSLNSFTVEALPSLEPPDELITGMTVQVKVSHFSNPSEFYVQRVRSLVKLSCFQKELRRYANSKQFFKKKISYKIDGLYMVLYHGDGNWSRCRLSAFVGPRMQLATVQYVDFGSTGTVDLKDLKPLPSAIEKIQPLAYQCRLDNCDPIEGTEWSDEAIVMALRILNLKGETNMTIVSHMTSSSDQTCESGIWFVRLVQESCGAPIDVGAALVLWELAQSKREASTLPEFVTKSIKLHPKPYHDQPKLTALIFQGVNFRVSHVVSPSEFYIAVTKTKVLDDVNAKSSVPRRLNSKGEGDRMVYYPIVGWPVLVMVEQGIYERGLITEVITKEQVEVFFVDSGKVGVWELPNLRYIDTRSCNRPPLAYKCSLADIAPLEDEVWPEPATELLRSFEDKILSCPHAEFVDGSWSVVLLQSKRDFDVCVNAVLVDKELAKSTGPYGEIVERPKSLPKPSVVPKTAAENVTIDDSGSNAVKGSDGIYRLKVTVVKFVDPGKFFVIIAGYEKAFEDLAKEMNQFYNKEAAAEVSKKEWKVGEYCAIKVDTNWARGMIVEELIEEQSLLVKLDDDMKEIKVRAPECVSLKPLDSRFRRLWGRVIECCLGGIVPAGSTSWTATSIQDTREEIDRHKDRLYIVMMKKHQPDQTVIPVELFMKIPKKPTAVTPATEDWMSWNHQLRMKGLAKPDEFTKWNSEGKREYIGVDNNIMEDENEEFLRLLKSQFHITKKGAIDLTNPRIISDEPKPCWLPPKPLEKSEFVAKPTFVGSSCEVFLQDVCNSTMALRQINEEVNKLCSGSLPPDRPMSWEIGDICLVRYHLDKLWYRGEILNDAAGLGTFLVKFVDYGNEEFVLPIDLRPTTGLKMRSIQCYQCFFDDLAPRGVSWEKSHIDAIHAFIVDKLCTVRLRVLRTGYLGIEKMILPDGRSVVDEIISMGMGVRLADRDRYLNPNLSENSESAVEEIEPKVDAPNHPFEMIIWPMIYMKDDGYEFPEGEYRLMEIPEEVVQVKVETSAVLSPDIFLVQIVESDNPELEVAINSYQGLVETLKEECISQPPLEPPYLWKACCCLFEGDDDWYRGIVIGDSSNVNGTLRVQYIDYGDILDIPVNQVKQLKKDWFDLPVRSLPCQIEGYKYSGSIPPREAMSSLLECLQSTDVWANIKKRERNLVVELQTPAGDLAYQRLIDEGVLIPVSH